jgi:xylulokinase
MPILALDIGTSAVKAAVLDTATAACLGPIARFTYTLDHPTPDAVEVPAERLWSAVVSAVRAATSHRPILDGLGLSTMSPALVLLDASDAPVVPIWTHLDRRSRDVARRAQAEVGDDFLRETGNRPLPGGITAISWRRLCQDDPTLPRRVRSYLHVNGWLVLRLTGERASDPANAAFTGLYGTHGDAGWSDRWCRYFEVDPAWLPRIVDGRETVGRLRPQTANELGIPAGIPVKIGTADTSSALLAVGAQRGDLLHVVGTTQVLATLVESPAPHPRRLTRPVGVGHKFVHVVHNPVGGAALSWIRDLCFRDLDDRAFYDGAIPHALTRPTCVTFDPPFLGGDRLEIEPRHAGFQNLCLATDRLDLLAALLRAMTNGHRQAIADLGLGQAFARIFLTGGGAEVVRRLLPEYAASHVHVLDEGSLRGVALLFRPDLEARP